MLLRTSCASRAARRPGSDHTAIARVATAMRPNLARSMSDIGQSLPKRDVRVTSPFPPIATEEKTSIGSFGPNGDIAPVFINMSGTNILIDNDHNQA
jgi:hypothetical protein